MAMFRGTTLKVKDNNYYDRDTSDGRRCRSSATIREGVKMKPAPPDRSMSKLRPLRALYSQHPVTGKREVTPTKLIDKRGTLKPHSNVLKFKNNVAQIRNVGRRTQIGINSKDSTRMSTAINAIAGMEKCPQLSGMFLRPSIDVRSFRKQIMERANRLGDSSTVEEGQQKVTGYKCTVMKSHSNGVCTPKPSGLSRAYLKLSESRKKSAALAAKEVVLSPPLSPFEERIIQNECKVKESRVTYLCPEKILDVSCIDSSEISADVKGKENDLSHVAVSGVKQFSSEFTSNTGEGAKKSIRNENIKHCVFNKILNHCQVYSSNMSNVSNRMNVLDDTFQKLMVAEIGDHLRARFLEYQNRKLKLYRKMELLEEELEKMIKNEVDVSSKFSNYLTKKRILFKERTSLQDNFENIVKQMIRNFEKKMVEPAKSENLEEIMRTMIPCETPFETERSESVLRRSKRLLASRRISEDEAKYADTPSRRKSIQGKVCEEKDDLVVMRRPNSHDKKRIQTCIYKDLQKSFNLCSPEFSF